MPAFNLLFAELVSCKQKQEHRANTLLVSATPHYYYLREILQIDPNDVSIWNRTQGAFMQWQRVQNMRRPFD